MSSSILLDHLEQPI
uniref:Uncharacterized protein n=1 Tax=Arundo donax TaxID=35708 RepID=A0A0A9H046_ARUDO